MSPTNIYDFYKILEIPRTADEEAINKALKICEGKMRERLNNPLTMTDAQGILKVIPAIRQALLSGSEQRTHYDQLLVEHNQPSEAEESHELDERFPYPFLFNPFTEYDTEEPTYTLREMALKMEKEWSRTRSWLADTSRSKHPLVSFLNYHALHPSLAAHIEESLILQRDQMSADEAVERCLTLLNPELERPVPRFIIDSLQEEGQTTFYLGEFLPEGMTQHTLTLTHGGNRGCLFGSIESQTDWLKLPDEPAQRHFSLLAEAISSPTLPTTCQFPLRLDLHALQHSAMHSAKLLIHVENTIRPEAITVQITLRISYLPPRVSFDPPATRNLPLLLGAIKQGERVIATLTPRNSGDESSIPLKAHLSTREANVHFSSQHLQTDKPITITIETQNRPRNNPYNILILVAYDTDQGAQGPAYLYFQGMILPNLWQSMLNDVPLTTRLLQSVIGGIIGIALAYTEFLLVKLFLILWFFLLPILYISLTYLSTKTLLTHQQRAGYPRSNSWTLSRLLLWCTAILLGILCASLGEGSEWLINGILYALAGFCAGFIIDKTSLLKTKNHNFE